MRLRVLYVYQGDWPRNATRVLKQTRALAEAGHDVCLLAGNPQGKPRFETNEWMRICRMPAPWPSKLRRLVTFPLFANPLWIWHIWRTARRYHADCLIVRDLPLAPAVLAVGTALRIPVHYEMADVYPVAMRSNRSDHPGLLSRIARNPATAEALDRLVVRNAASVLVVSEESRERCLSLGAGPKSVVIVGNTPVTLPNLTCSYPVPQDLSDWTSRLIVIFQGNLLADRGLPVAIRAVMRARNTVPEIAFAIIGDGREQAQLAAQIADEGASEFVRLLGWKAHSEHTAYYRMAAIGVLPFLDTEHINITLANKLFDYMAAALPIVASDVRPMRRVLAETEAGLLVPAGDVDALAATLVELARDPARRRDLGARGRHAVEDEYSWRRDRERLLETIAGRGRVV